LSGGNGEGPQGAPLPSAMQTGPVSTLLLQLQPPGQSASLLHSFTQVPLLSRIGLSSGQHGLAQVIFRGGSFPAQTPPDAQNVSGSGLSAQASHESAQPCSQVQIGSPPPTGVSKVPRQTPPFKQLAHLPRQSQGCFSRWRRRSRLLTQRVRALAKSHSSVSRSKGTWQTRTQSSSSSSARAREGISAAMAVPAMSFSAPRRLSEPSAIARASSSKEWLVVSWLTWSPSRKGGTRQPRRVI
jgi:hypothetical protein